MGRHIGRVACGAVALVGILATLAGGQTTAPQEAQPANPLPVIADEPLTIDAAQFVPEPLRKKATADFGNVSLREVAAWLRDEQQLAVLLETDAIAEVGLLPSDPIRDRLSDEPIYLLLDRLAMVDLGWYYENDVLRITTSDKAAERYTTEPYDIGPLLDAGYEADSLIDVLVSTIAADEWQENGGNGAVSMLGDVLFVRQAAATHRAVQGLLAALGTHGRRTFVSDPEQHAPLRRALSTAVSVTLVDVPLAAAIEQLSRESGIDIRLDRTALDELGVRERQPVSLSLADRQLGTVLQALLVDLDLTYAIGDGVLWITSRERADQRLKTAVYDVRDLCRDDDESAALIDAIATQTSEVWADYGGNSELRAAKAGTLVIYATEEVHDEVLQLLETYRTALRKSKPRAGSQGPDKSEVITLYYKLDAEVASSLEAELATLVGESLWKSTDAESAGRVIMLSSKPEVVVASEGKTTTASSVKVPKNVLVVTHTREVHDAISEVIRRVEYGDAASGGFGGGGLGGGGGGFGGGFFAVPGEQPRAK